MDGRNNKGPPDLKKSTIDSSLPTTNKSVPRGLLFRELGCKRKQNSVSPEFQIAAEDRLVVKSHAELPCELPDVSRSTFLMVFSPDGTKVASTHGNHNVYVTDLNSGKNVNTLSGHPRTPWCIAFHPSSNQILASGCLGGQVRVWDLHGGSEIWTAESQTVIASLAFHPTDRMLVIATYNELHFWDWSQPVPFTKCYTSNEKEKVRYVAFDPLGHKLITGISNAPHNQTQWDRVATPSHRGSSFASLSRSGTRNTSTSIPPEERRIAVCYRSLVEQYEQLVQRYYDLSRSRTTPTMDRGTDPMDLSESSVSGSTSTTHLPATDNNSRMSVHQENSSSNSGNDSSSVNASDNSNSNISPTSSNNANRSTSSADNARPRSRDRLRHIPSVVLMHSLIRRFDRQSELLGRQRSEDSHGQEETSIPPVATQRPQSVRSGSAVLEEGDNARDTSAREPSRSEQQGLFPQNQSAPCQPERPRRFFISQRSAFQPRIPRGSSEETHSEPHTTGAQTPNSIPNTRHFILRHPPYNTSALHNDESTRSEQQNLDSTADVGVRYGIQLLSRHIDNMQRLCRARLEILQLQQIRRMWEDLQRQIRSLHVAVRESTFALSDNIDPPSSRGRRRRLYSHPNEEPALGHSNWRSDPETGITEQGVSHIPSVSQMLEHTRISDSNNSQTPGPARDSSTSSEQPVNSRESLYAEKKGTLARLQAQFAALTKLRLSVEKKSNSNKDGENSRTSIGSSSSHGDVCISRLQPPEPSISQTTDPVISQREPVAGTSAQSSDAATEIPSFAELPEKTEESTDEVDRPIKKKREELMSNSEMKESSPVSSGSSSFTSYESSTSSSIPTILTTTVPTITTITSNCSGSRERPEAGHRALYSQLGGNWSRYPTPNVSAIANSPNPPSPHQQRLWRISRRVYLRRPRLLALGPRTRSMARQMNSGSATHRSYSSSIFRQQEYGRRPWFLQSTHRNQLSRTSERGISTGAQVDPQGSEASAPEASEDNVIVSSQSASPLSSDTSLIVTTPSDQSSSPSKGTCYQSTSKSCPSMSSQIEEQPGPSGCQEEPHGVKRKADTHSTAACPGTSKDRDSGSSQTHRGQTTSQSLRSMISRLESLVRQQREQREAAERLQERSHPHGASFWDACLPDGITSGSDSDSNPETDRHQSWNEANSNERLMQVLSLMVESLTQFFEDNGLSNSSSHAVLDEQIYNLYILLQLALELTDLLLAQLVSTRRELEHQWVHRLRSPVALDEGRTTTRDRPHPPRRRGRYPSQERGSMGPANVLVQSLRRRSPSPFDVRRGFVDEHHSRSRLRILDGSRGSHRPRSRPVNPADYNRSSRMGPAYRRLLRFRNHHPVMEAFMAQFLQTSNSGTTSSNTPSTPSTPISPSAATEVIQGMRRLGPRVVSGYARHFSNSLNPGGPRRDNTLGVPPYIRNTPELIRNSTSDIPPYIQNTPEARDTTLGVPPYIQNTPEVRVNTLGIPPYIRMTPEIRDNTLGIPPYIRNTPEVRDNTLDTPPYIRNSSEIRDNTLGITPSLEIRDNTLGIPPYIRGSSENRFRGEGNTTVPSSPRAPHIMVRVQVPGSSVSADQPSSQDHHQPPSSQQQQDTFTVPLVRVNDVLIPDTSILSQPQPIHRPQSPPPQYPSPNIRNPFIQHPPPQQMSQQLPSPYRYLGTHSGSPGEPSWRNWRPRFLHPRYMAPNPFNEDEEPSVAPVFENINFIRGNTRDSFIIADAPMSPNHRIQAWDFSRLTIPDISNAEKNVIVGECKIHNDASVDVSNDGRLLVTLLPTGRLSSTAMLGVYSLEWESLGQCLYTTSFEQNAVSVSLSPTSRHLLVGLASRRVALLPSDRLTMAQIFRLEGGVPGRTVGARGRLCHVRDVEQDREQGYMSLNCIRWAPRPGQGLVYGTNTGKLRVLR